jgi:hypothetical protein
MVFASISVALMAWGLYAQRKCWTYDAGRPFWRCEAPNFFIELLSAPPVVLSRPITNALHNAPSFLAYVVELPFIFVWWWFIGTRLDFGLLGVGPLKRRRVWLGFYSALIALLLAFFSLSLWEGIQFYQKYSYLHENPYLASIANPRSLPLQLWSLILIVGFALAVVRIARGRTGQLGNALVPPRTLRLFALGFGLYCMCAAILVWHSKLVERQEQTAFELQRILVKGRVLDDSGAPVYAIKVSLVPILDSGALAENESAYDFTNKDGEYTLSPEQAGSFNLAVQWEAPPSTKLPFLPRYYPDSIDPKQAEVLQIAAARHMTMSPIRLRWLGLVKVPVMVSWSGGKPEPDAHLLFFNSQFPESGIIGSESLNPDADGTVSLPVGFDYEASAQVECDAGPKIESTSTPRLRLSLKLANPRPEPLHFVLPGNPCRIWHPQ